MFNGKDIIFLFQNAANLETAFDAPSQFAISLMYSARKDLRIAVYSCHENESWDLFTSTLEQCFINNPKLSVKLVINPNCSSQTVLTRLKEIKQQYKKLELRFNIGAITKGAGSNGKQHSKLWIADDMFAMEGSLNISQPAFETNMENGFGFKDKEIVQQIGSAFDSIWRTAKKLF